MAAGGPSTPLGGVVEAAVRRSYVPLVVLMGPDMCSLTGLMGPTMVTDQLRATREVERKCLMGGNVRNLIHTRPLITHSWLLTLLRGNSSFGRI